MPVNPKKGIISASSFMRGHPPANAFKKRHSVLAWVSSPKEGLPQTISIRFKKSFVLAKFGFSSRSKCCLEQAPLEFDLLGSKNCKRWKVIRSYKTRFRRLKQSKIWTIPLKRRRSMRCYGIRIKKVLSGRVAAIKNFRLWKPKGWHCCPFVYQVKKS